MLRRYIQTVRHLRREQIAAQLGNRVRRVLERPERWDPGEAPGVPEWNRNEPAGLRAPVPSREVGHILAGLLKFAGEEREVGWLPKWEGTAASKLWHYNLHYHDWLWALSEAGEWEATLEAVLDWIKRYPLKRGAVGWDPYPISLRLQNWLLLLFRRDGDLLVQSGSLDVIWHSVWRQARRLEARLEFHLLGNHLLENAATLCLLGATFGGEDGGRWREKGIALLRRELPEQFPPDGLHFERSPMYHLRATWLLELLTALDAGEISTLAADRLPAARRALGLLRHSDGGIALLGDAGIGIYSGVEPGAAEEGAWSLPDSGYYGFRSSAGDYLVCDAGPIGPDHLPGHGHAGGLSFELSLGGRRVITDTGVSDYEDSASRAYVRSTAAHNTVEIEGRDQAEMWGAFRVGARGRPCEVDWRPRAEGFFLGAAHSGYRRLPERVAHRREFDFAVDRRALEIRDTVVGRGSYRAVARLHFAPDCAVEHADGELRVIWPGGRLRVAIEGDGRLELGERPYFERFGERQMRTTAQYSVQVEERARWTMRLDWS